MAAVSGNRTPVALGGFAARPESRVPRSPASPATGVRSESDLAGSARRPGCLGPRKGSAFRPRPLGKGRRYASGLPSGLARVRSAANRSSEKLTEIKSLNETLDPLRREAMELRAKAREELRGWIVARVREFARQHGYSVIFDRTRAGVGHLGSQVDATPSLIEWVDRSHGSVRLGSIGRVL